MAGFSGCEDHQTTLRTPVSINEKPQELEWKLPVWGGFDTTKGTFTHFRVELNDDTASNPPTVFVVAGGVTAHGNSVAVARAKFKFFRGKFECEEAWPVLTKIRDNSWTTFSVGGEGQKMIIKETIEDFHLIHTWDFVGVSPSVTTRFSPD
jgi:hypothetical protein